MAAVYSVFTSPNHAPIPNHLPTLIVTPHGQPSNVLYSYLHTNFNAENYLLTPSPQGDLCVAKMFPPSRNAAAKYAASDPGHSSGSAPSRAVRCEASRNLKWTITNTGVMSPIYKLSLPSPDGPDLPLFQVSKPNPNANFWSMFYFAYAGHSIPPKRIEFGKIQKNPPGPGGGGTRISITGKSAEEKAVWQTLGEGNEDCVEWVVLCAALNLLDDEILRAAEKAGAAPSSSAPPSAAPTPASSNPGTPGTRPGPGPGPGGASRQGSYGMGNGAPPPNAGPGRGGPPPGQRPPPPQQGGGPGPMPNGQYPPQQRPPPPPNQMPNGPGGMRPPPPPQQGQSYPRAGSVPPPGQYPPPQGGRGAPPPQGYNPNPQQRPPPPQGQGQGYPQQQRPPPPQGQGYPQQQRGPPPQGYPQGQGQGQYPSRSGSAPPPQGQGGAGGGRRV